MYDLILLSQQDSEVIVLISNLTDKKLMLREVKLCTNILFSDEAEIQIKICSTPELTVHSTMLYHITEGLK